MIAARTTLAMVCLTALLCQGCEKPLKTLGELGTVHAEIVKRFGDKEVSIRENTFGNSTNIIVTFINSSLNDKALELRATRAQETANVVKELYPSIASIDEIWIQFVRLTTRFVVFHYTEGVGAFAFDRNARPLTGPKGREANTEVKTLTARASYIPAQNQTEISLELLLEGNPLTGLSMIPHFTLAGDATQRPSASPEIVRFDFVSYSPRPRFKPNSTLIFNVDNKSLLDTDVTFSVSKGADGQVAELLSLPMPYEEFLHIANATNVTISIGDQTFPLKHEQVIALKNMNAFIRKTGRSGDREKRRREN